MSAGVAGVLAADPARRAEAAELAQRLAAPLLEAEPARGVFLALGAERLELRSAGGEPGPVCAEWVRGPLGYRRAKGGGRGQALARAVGLGPGRAPAVVDATAGLGRDAMLLACLGCRVTAVERSPVLSALLRDGLARAQADPELAAALGGRLRLVEADAAAWLAALPPEEAPEVVYLDPMHPPRRKSALVKKEMRVLRAVVGEDPDAGALFLAARAAARERVVVKRPLHAPELGPAPDRRLAGRSTRFDVYRAPA